MARRKNKEVYIDFDLQNYNLDDMIIFILSNNALVTRSSLLKVQKLINKIDDSKYETDRVMVFKIFFIRKFLEGKLDNGIEDFSRLIDYVKGMGQYADDVDDLIDSISNIADISDEEVIYIDKTISDILSHHFIYNIHEKLVEKSIDLKSQNYDNLGDFCNEYSDIVMEINTGFNKIKPLNKETKMDFSTNNLNELTGVIGQTINILNKPNNRIKSSVEFLNRMTNGGFESGRFYLFLGFSGGWKSGLLLNIILDAKKYNDKFITNDPTKEPAILYVTQENSIVETIERIWSHYIGDDDEIKNYTMQEAVEILKENGFSEGVDLIIKYRSTKTISTADIDAMIDDERNNGKEIVMVVHDYVKRINSASKHDSAYDELGAIADEFADMAKRRGIPVISASQFNREGNRIRESAHDKNNNGVLQKIGVSHIGESIKMIENSDVVIAIHPESVRISEEEYQEYLTFRRLKFRGKPNLVNDVSYFAHPFLNGMQLDPDIHEAKSKSLLDLNLAMERFDPVAYRKNSNEFVKEEDRESKGRKNPDKSISSSSTFSQVSNIGSDISLNQII